VSGAHVAAGARRPAVLVLESGRVFRGVALGGGEAFGEAVFNTSLTGYQEILTDPSYAGQIVVMTAPQIGNTGVNDEDLEAARPACAGFAVREASPRVSSWRARGDLDRYLDDAGVVGIEDIDTRALTRALRQGGAQRAAISAEPEAVSDPRTLIERVLASPQMEGRDLVSEVTCQASYTWDEPGWRAPDLAATPVPPAELHVVAYDFGIKRNILRDLRDAGCRMTVVPARTSAAEVLALAPDGVFLSNGPGDPAAVTYAIDVVRELIAATGSSPPASGAGVPIFGICLGHQILSLALGARTFKLPFGHHGGNHPVRDRATGKVEITAQNHGFAVDPKSLPDGVIASHDNLYDGTCEGVLLADRPVFSVQYHPEASPGPHDAHYLFSRFVAAMRGAPTRGA
jgi:carbamoyl-phosphate synthase small subunit